MLSIVKRLNKIIYVYLFHVDLDLHNHFLEQITSFQFNQRNKNLIRIILLTLVIDALRRIIFTSLRTKNDYIHYDNEPNRMIIIIMYILFILNFLILLLFFVLFGIPTSYVQLKLTTSGWRTYIHDGLLVFSTFVICNTLILKIINGNCSNEILCDIDGNGLPFLIGASLSPIFMSVVFSGIQFITILLNCLITFITLMIANTLFEWTSKYVFILIAYIIFCPTCIFYIHKLELNRFVLTKKLTSRYNHSNDRDDLESFIKPNTDLLQDTEHSNLESKDDFLIPSIPSTAEEDVMDNTSIVVTSCHYPILESSRDLNDFSIFYHFYEEEFLIALYEFKSGKISDNSSIWKLFPHLALPQLYNMDKDRVEYGLKSLPEATNFLLDLTLGPKLILLFNTILDKIHDTEEMKIQELLGSYQNAMILLSCTTLFFYSSFGTSYNRIFEILMRKCREELHVSDSETQLFCSESANCYR